MAACTGCGTTIVFGGEKRNGYRYCSKKCADKTTWNAFLPCVPWDLAEEEAARVFRGPCPKCQRQVTVDLYIALGALKIPKFSEASNEVPLACTDCARKSLLRGAAVMALLGWLSWETLLVTPFIVVSNLLAYWRMEERTAPSDLLVERMRAEIAKRVDLNVASQRELERIRAYVDSAED